MNSRLRTAGEVAEMLAVSVETVLRWTRRGELPALKLPGGAIRFREADLEAWLEKRMTRTTGSSELRHLDGFGMPVPDPLSAEADPR